MKILINRQPVSGPWGGGNTFVKALIQGLKKSGHSITHSLDDDIDCFFMVDPRPDPACPGIANVVEKFGTGKVKIIHRVNECDARKNTEHMDHLLLQCSSVVDKTVFVSRWMGNYFLAKGWRCQNNLFIHNGVDKNVFKPLEKSSRKIKSVVAHHWSNNLLKGFDAYEFLDYLAGKGKIRFTYIGRHRDSFENTKIIPPCTGEDLAKQLADHDVYISGSRFDPGPNHILEALAVGLPTYVHANGGGAVEFAGESHTFKNLIELEKIILADSHDKNQYEILAWNDSIAQYVEAIETI